MASSFTNIIHSISKAVKGDDSESGTLNGELESHSKAELRDIVDDADEEEGEWLFSVSECNVKTICLFSKDKAAAAVEQEADDWSLVSKEGNMDLKVYETSKTQPLVYMILNGIRASVSVQVCMLSHYTKLHSGMAWVGPVDDFATYHKFAFKSGTEAGRNVAISLFDFTLVDWAPCVFRSLRQLGGVNDKSYLESFLQPALIALRSPGKSGSFFYGSSDMKYIIKSLTKEEHSFLLEFLPKYTAEKCKYTYCPLLWATLYPNTRQQRNILGSYGKHFPTKGNGSTHGRTASQSELAANDPVLKDLDLLRGQDSLRFGPVTRSIFLRIVKSDAAFLAENNIMDYSLLVGMHHKHKNPAKNTVSAPYEEPKLPGMGLFFRKDSGGIAGTDDNDAKISEIYYLGIIDILQTYNTRKKVEHSLKALTSRHEISCVDPVTYNALLNSPPASSPSLSRAQQTPRGKPPTPQPQLASTPTNATPTPGLTLMD